MPAGSWVPPIVPTVATRDQGGVELLAAIRRHRLHLESDRERLEAHRESGARERVRTLLKARLIETAWDRLEIEPWLAEQTLAVARRETSPYSLVDGILRRCWTDGSEPASRREGGKE